MSNTIATIIKSIRLAHGLTQEQLAELIDRSPGHVGMLEQGRATPSYDVLVKLVQNFKIDANLLFDGSRQDAESISAGIIRAVENMPAEVRECLRLYTHIVDQFSKEIKGSVENGEK